MKGLFKVLESLFEVLESFWGLGESFKSSFEEFLVGVEVANVSLLALYDEGKSDPDPPPWTPAIHHPSSTTNLESHTCDWGPNQ